MGSMVGKGSAMPVAVLASRGGASLLRERRTRIRGRLISWSTQIIGRNKRMRAEIAHDWSLLHILERVLGVGGGGAGVTG